MFDLEPLSLIAVSASALAVIVPLIDLWNTVRRKKDSRNIKLEFNGRKIIISADMSELDVENLKNFLNNNGSEAVKND